MFPKPFAAPLAASNHESYCWCRHRSQRDRSALGGGCSIEVCGGHSQRRRISLGVDGVHEEHEHGKDHQAHGHLRDHYAGESFLYKLLGTRTNARGNSDCERQKKCTAEIDQTNSLSLRKRQKDLLHHREILNRDPTAQVNKGPTRPTQPLWASEIYHFKPATRLFFGKVCLVLTVPGQQIGSSFPL